MGGGLVPVLVAPRFCGILFRAQQVVLTRTRTSTRPLPLYLSPGQDAQPLPLSLLDAGALLLPASIVKHHHQGRWGLGC